MQQLHYLYNNYQQHQGKEVECADPVRLITLLLEGAIRFTKKTVLAVEAKNKIDALQAIDRASKIVMHLYSCLDFDNGGEIAERLGSLYSYVIDQIFQFCKKPDDMGALNSINQVLNIILDAWKEIEKKGVNRERE